MPVNAGIPVKPGRLGTGSIQFGGHNPIRGEVFRSNNETQLSNLPAGPGGLITRPTNQVWASPNINHYNTATIRKVPAKTTLQNAFVFSPKRKPLVQPQVRSILPDRKVIPVVHMAFGGSPDMPSDTAFHPINQPRSGAKVQMAIRSDRAGEKHDLSSFSSHNNLWGDKNNSFYSGRQSVTDGRVGRGRWHVQKQGVL